MKKRLTDEQILSKIKKLELQMRSEISELSEMGYRLKSEYNEKTNKDILKMERI